MSNPLNVGSGVLGSDGGESNGVSESGVAPRRRLRVGKPVLVVVGVVLVVVQVLLVIWCLAISPR